MKHWFSIQNSASETEATVTIFDEIGYWGINAVDFHREFSAIKAPVINLEINSPGGSVFDGVAIYNMLKGSGKTINAKVMGIAASIASVILMAADKITMPSNTFLMVHAPSGGVFGTAEEMREMADVLDKISAGLTATYMKRTGKSEDEVKAMLSKDTWLTAAEAKELGFADEVSDAVEATARFNADADVLAKMPEGARAAFKAAAATAEPPADPAPAAVDPEPAASAEPAPTPLADQVQALAVAAGFQAFVPVWATACASLDDAKARIETAREIKALCVVAGKPGMVDELVFANKSLADARVAVTNAIAAGDVHVDTAPKSSNQPTNSGPVGGKTTADVWAKFNNRK